MDLRREISGGGTNILVQLSCVLGAKKPERGQR